MQKIYFNPRPMGKSWAYRLKILQGISYRVRLILGGSARLKPDNIWIDEMAESVKIDEITRKRLLFGDWKIRQ